MLNDIFLTLLLRDIYCVAITCEMPLPVLLYLTQAFLPYRHFISWTHQQHWHYDNMSVSLYVY